jgi:hypothetical protein
MKKSSTRQPGIVEGKPNQAVLLGQKIGARLVPSVAEVMFREYLNQLSAASPSAQRWNDAWDLLTDALGVMRADPDVAVALRALDEAHGAALVEGEDTTWHAAFRLAMGLKGGAR